MNQELKLPIIDLSQDRHRHVVIAQGTEEVYHAHPTTVLLPDGRTMFVAWTYGHGGVCGPLKKSTDGGLTWSDLLPVPDNWSSLYNCPTLYRLVGPDGKARIFVFTGHTKDGDEMHQAYSEDDGETWTPMMPNGIRRAVMPWCTIVSISGGRLLAQTNARRPGDPDTRSNLIIQSISHDGGLTWGAPRVVLDMPGYKPCEPCIVRSPDGTQLISIMRENSRKLNSLVMISDDEGKTWAKPR